MASLLAEVRRMIDELRQAMVILLLKTGFLDVGGRDQAIKCRLLQTPQVPHNFVRPRAEVVGVQRPVPQETTPPPVQGTQQSAPQIPLHSFGRGRGAIMIAQLYNHQLQEHFSQYQAQQTQQQQLYLQQQTQNSLADLPELEPIGQDDDNFEDINED
jgi:hypothetical protein